MTNKAFEAELQSRLDALPQGKAPERDLWKGIELGIEDGGAIEKKSGSGRLVAVAASVGLVATLSWFGVQTTIAPEQDIALQGDQLVEALSTQYQAQREALLVQFSDTTAVTENWEQQLNELDQAAVAIKLALKEDPNNKALLRMLQSVYQQQIELIERVHAPKWRQI